MANTRELRRRIKSVKNTSQITRAMQMVAATKMRRAQNQAVSGRPYSENLSEALARLLPKVKVKAHPLLSGNESAKNAVVLLSTDKGLVGALNTNLFRVVSAAHASKEDVFYTVGKKGRSLAVKLGQELVADFENLDTVTFRLARQLGKMVIDSFLAGEIGGAFLVYPHFVSTLKQEAKRVRLLPISLELEGDPHAVNTPRDDAANEFLFEPSVDILLDSLLVHNVHIKIYQALLETKASEHSSRMVAMKNATDNAKELVSDLTLTYNQTRQDAITKEILEIATAQVAMQ